MALNLLRVKYDNLMISVKTFSNCFKMTFLSFKVLSIVSPNDIFSCHHAFRPPLDLELKYTVTCHFTSPHVKSQRKCQLDYVWLACLKIAQSFKS